MNIIIYPLNDKNIDCSFITVLIYCIFLIKKTGWMLFFLTFVQQIFQKDVFTSIFISTCQEAVYKSFQTFSSDTGLHKFSSEFQKFWSILNIFCSSPTLHLHLTSFQECQAWPADWTQILWLSQNTLVTYRIIIRSEFSVQKIKLILSCVD